MPKRPKPFNNPFGRLKQLQPTSPRTEPTLEDEGELFRATVGEVLPPPGAHYIPSPPAEKTTDHVFSDEDEALATLRALVQNEGPIDLSDSDEYIEGAIASFDRKTLRKLRNGDFSIQAHLDLHGLTKDEAKECLARFLEESRRDGHRLVLIVHGRGLHSKDQIPVLKESLRVWLSQGRIGKHVIAFTTARPHDGGAGALYLLLRR